jgi:hypothetical protein
MCSIVLLGVLRGSAQKGSLRGNPDAVHQADLAATPPMGWNSFDAYCGHVTESEVKANADELAKSLARYGWKYVVVDYYWYYPHPKTDRHEGELEVAMDEYGRLLPATNRFPSAQGGKGFKPLADYVHSKGLKFGIHIMRGIPRQAVKRNLPILGTEARAQDVADLGDPCSWSTAMHGVDTTKPAGQAYYRSIAKLYADWGVDYIKADDMSWGGYASGARELSRRRNRGASDGDDRYGPADAVKPFARTYSGQSGDRGGEVLATVAHLQRYLGRLETGEEAVRVLPRLGALYWPQPLAGRGHAAAGADSHSRVRGWRAPYALYAR